MKKIFNTILGLGVCAFALASCTGSPDQPSQSSSSSEDVSESSESSSSISEIESSKSSSSESGAEKSEESSSTLVDEYQKKASTAYIVGDSTVCSFEDISYYYPRYGYGTQLGNYFDSYITFNNLALSGRSSKSYLTENEYQYLSSSIKAGDYLIIGFGHNDEKNDDQTRYSPVGDVSVNGTFKYNLYNNYIKLAKDNGATPILCTPICRADTSDNYEGSSAHVTSVGDYPKEIRDLAKDTNTALIDLTAITKSIYSSKTFNEVIKYHAWTNSNSASADKTHLNIYGAKNVAYNFANAMKDSDCELAHYVKENITAPTEADLVVNPNYVEKSYSEFTDSAKSTYFTKFSTAGYYGTCFGDLGGSPNSSRFIAEETTQGTFKVGQQATVKGKIGSTEGIAMIFRQVSVAKNFTMTCDVKVLEAADTTSAGFGLMLRDDIYIDLRDSTVLSNYVTAGMYNTSSSTQIVYSRENTKLSKGAGSVSTSWAVDDTATLSIERIGQVVNCKVVYKGVTYTNTYTDFDFIAIDNNYMYVGLYATRGTVIQTSNLTFTITGDAISA